jgi:hypothetical protein
MMGRLKNWGFDLENLTTACHLGFYLGLMMGRPMGLLKHWAVDLENSTKMAHHLGLYSGLMMERLMGLLKR